MADVKWIKIATDLFDNRKIRQIESLPDGDAIIVIWMKLLCLAGNINEDGMVYFTKEIPFTDQMLATQFNRPIATVQLALATFEEFSMVEVIDNLLHISNWEKYQNVEGMEKIREQNRIRQARYKEKQKLLTSNVTDNVMVTDGNATDKNRIDKNRVNKNIDSDSCESSAPAKPKKHKHGEYDNVLLTDDEYDKLKAEYSDIDNRIENLSSYVASTGKRYKSHYATIRNWAKKDKEKQPIKKNQFNNFPQRERSDKEMSDLERAMLNKTKGAKN